MSKKQSIGELFKALTAEMSPADVKSAMVISDISERITSERLKRSMTQKEFAAFMNVTQSMVSKWESAEYNFTIESLSKIFDKLGLDYHFSVSGDLKLMNIEPTATHLNGDSDYSLLLIAG